MKGIIFKEPVAEGMESSWTRSKYELGPGPQEVTLRDFFFNSEHWGLKQEQEVGMG